MTTSYDESEQMEITQSVDVTVVQTFEEMQLREVRHFSSRGTNFAPQDLLRGIYAYGFERPSAIQQRAIKPIVSGRDVIAQSQSGTVSRMRL